MFFESGTKMYSQFIFNFSATKHVNINKKKCHELSSTTVLNVWIHFHFHFFFNKRNKNDKETNWQVRNL